jgi:signal transduction histidine kinase/ActR/RegA family two-component response regulator
VFRDVREKKEQEARRAFVADATTMLASSLDYQDTLVRLAELFVPRFADWCAVDIVDPDSRGPRRLAVMHIDPAKIQLARELAEKYPDAPDAPQGLPNVLRTGKSELYADITDEMVNAGARDDEHRRIIVDLQLRSAMLVPLVARERTLGAISLVYAESGRKYSADDLAFIEDVARRAAVVIDNAQLYASEREARVAADVANRTKDEFLATISHELRTPLNAILGWARMMSKSPAEEARRERALETIQRNAVAMTDLIEDLLDVSRIISGKVRLDREPVDLMRVLDMAVDSVRPSIDSKSLDVRMPARVGDGAGPVTVIGDSGRLRQVLCNLLSNAVKFTGGGGRIDILVRPMDAAIEIEIRDTGRGIDAAFLPHVFDPFRQADGSITRAHGGLGLGLSISRHLVELHGGKIHAHSDGVGRGATFVVTLPIDAGGVHDTPAATTGTDTPAMNVANHPARLRGLKVLTVDDDPDARQLVQAVLEDCGSIVRVASTVAEAMRAIEEEIPDVLLSDIGMPGEDGYTLIRRVRALPAGRGGTVPAAALTAYARAEDRRNVLNAGYTIHLPKPLEPAALIAVVAQLATNNNSGTHG